MLLRTAPQPTRAERLLNATKLHEILRIALDDLKVVEKDPRYVINMHNWHNAAKSSGACEVCLAGATLAVSMQVPTSSDRFPGHSALPEGMAQKLYALNALRRGEVDLAQSLLCGGAEWAPDFDDLISMKSGTPKFGAPNWWQFMERMHRDLVEADI